MLSKKSLWSGLNEPDLIENEVEVGILGVPFDSACCQHKGAKYGPDAIRKLSAEFPNVSEVGNEISLRIRDFGDVDCPPLDVEATGKNITSSVTRLKEKEIVPVCLGGDHSVSFPILRAITREKKTGVIWIDAHPDLMNSNQDSKYSHACPLRRTLELPNVDNNDVFMIGLREFVGEELDYIRQNEMNVIYARDFSQLSPFQIAERITEKLRHLPQIYISFDIDVLDPAFAPGTGVPVSGGITSRELYDLIHGLKGLPIAGFDVVEVAPSLENSDITSRAGMKIVYETLSILTSF